MQQLVFSEDGIHSVANQLIAFARENSAKIWAFYGEMGAGKTTLIKSVCKSLGVQENVSSPTFSIVNEYENSDGKPIYHFDFYRLKNEREAVDIGCEEYFESGFLCVIEWPEKILNLLPHPLFKISLEVTGEKRMVTFSYE